MGGHHDLGTAGLVPAITFFSTASAVSIAGGRPVPVDVRADTLAIDVADAMRRVNSRTRAIVAVHLGGQPVDVTAVTALASKSGLALVEDAAQTFGAEWESQLVGTFGALTTYSFQSGKILTAGEGGALVIRSGGAVRGGQRLARVAV